MPLKQFYKQWVPAGLRHFIAGHPRIQDWRNRGLVREGRKLAQAARAARPPDGRIRAAFIVQRPALWPNQQSVYAAMRADPGFEVSVLAIPKIPPAARSVDLEEYRRLKQFLAEQAIPFREGYDEQAGCWINPLAFGLPDVVLLPQPYLHTQSYLYGAHYLKHFCKLAIWNYGQTIDDIQLYRHYLPAYAGCDFIFMESEPARKLMAEFAPALADRLVVTGPPKLDAYLRSPSADLRLWKRPDARHRIIWAPHFTVAENRTPHTFSNFFEYYEYFIDAARRLPTVEFVLRPHPELFAHMVAAGLKTRAEAEAFRDRFNALPNGQVYEGGEIFEMFRQSDALILDSISFLLEYLPTGRPICFLDSLRRQRLNPIGEQLLHAYYSAWDAAEIEEFIQTVVVGGDDYRRADRERVARKYIHQPPGGSGQAIKDRIRKALA